MDLDCAPRHLSITISLIFDNQLRCFFTSTSLVAAFYWNTV